MKHIVDCHCHIYPEKIASKAVESIGAFYDIPMCLDGRCETLLKEGAAAGTTHFMIFSVATTPKQTKSINEFIAREADAHPGLMTGLGTVHPDSEDLAGDIRHIKELGLRGIKLHPDFQRFGIDEKRCLKIYELCEGELPVLFHTGDHRYDYSNPNRVKPILEAFKGLTVIGAHLGGWSVWEKAAEELAGYENFFVDSSSSLFALTPERATEIIKLYGADRVVYGTDFPMWKPDEEIKRFNRLDLTEEERDKIFGRNADKLFKLNLC